MGAGGRDQGIGIRREAGGEETGRVPDGEIRDWEIRRLENVRR